MIIAIDGPSGSGKSTVARRIADELGFHYLDTGAMYRAVALVALRRGISPDDQANTAMIARDEPIEFGTSGPSSVSIGGVEVTSDIRTKEVDGAVSAVSACPDVRTALVTQQRRIAQGSNIVMEGRDIGTVVFPDAEVKVFLTASAQARAHRRCEQNRERGVGDTDEGALLAAMEARDVYDSTRETAPLRAASDAVIVDTSNLTIDQVVANIEALAEARRSGQRGPVDGQEG